MSALPALNRAVAITGVAGLVCSLVIVGMAGSRHEAVQSAENRGRAECVQAVRDLADGIRSAADGYPYRGKDL